MPSPPVALCVLLVPWKLSAGIQVTHSRDINQSSRQLRDPYPLRHLDLACVNWNSGCGEPFWGLVCWSNGRGAPRRCVEANTVLWGLWGSRPAVTGGTGLRGEGGLMLGRRAWNLPPCSVPVLGPSAFVCVIYTQFAESTRRKILFSLPNGPHLPRLPGMSLGISLPRMCSGFLIQKQILKTAKHLAGSYF